MANNNAQQDGMLNPGEIIRPQMTEECVSDLVKRIFGLNVLSIKELKSYDDRNFFVKVSPPDILKPQLDEVSTAEYVLKVTNSLDSKKTDLLDAQNEMMLFLKERGFNVTTPAKTLKGSYKALESLKENGSLHVIRLLNFLPGKMLYDVPYTASLFSETGEYVAKLDNALQDFENVHLRERYFLWMMSAVPELSKFIYVLKEEWKVVIIKDILATWESSVVPLLDTFNKGIIHGDINEQNILITPNVTDPSKYHIAGLIDFGDISSSCYVFELAIAITYLMLEVKTMPVADAGGHILAGYLRHRALSEDEWMVLKTCVGARLAQSLVLGAYSYTLDPGNEYLLTSAINGWKILREFWPVPSNQIISRWKEIIATYNQD